MQVGKLYKELGHEEKFIFILGLIETGDKISVLCLSRGEVYKSYAYGKDGIEEIFKRLASFYEEVE